MYIFIIYKILFWTGMSKLVINLGEVYLNLREMYKNIRNIVIFI